MASQLGLPLVPDTSYYYPRFYLGLSEGEKRESGEIPSCDMCFDGRYYAVSGFITGAIGAKFPGMNHLVEGVVDTTVSAGERLAYAVFDDSMSWDEKWAYAFDPGQMVADFVTGVVIGEILDGIMAAIQNRLRSIFANYDAAMREAFESGRNTATTINYSYKFDRELANFNDGYEIRTTVDKDLILVQYSSDAPDASLCYWTTVDEANRITTLNDYMDKLALSKDWGNRNTVKVARIPAGIEVKYAVGTAREQLLIADPRPGGGVQYLFNQFDTDWITEIRSFSN